jgi:protein-tyrosine phosphatase
MMKLVFICSGNTSRSPMAEGLFRKMVGNVDVSSAGFSTQSGENADEYACLVCRKHGIDLSDFKTTNISDVDFNGVDLVLAATVENREKIKRFYPNINAHTIKEYSGCYSDLDIKDPSDGGLGDYVVCYFEIKEALEKILKTHSEFEVLM